jgi:Sulfotransferase family
LRGVGPVLVTGSPRSGTTWVGQMLALSPDAGYIFEPFHPHSSAGISAAVFDQWYTYIDTDNANRYQGAIARTLGFSYDFRAELSMVASPRDFARMGRDAAQTTFHRLLHHRAIMKDPNAVFSSEWLARTFSMDVVFTIRHPAAVVSSLLRLGWTTDFSQFTHQPRLIQAYLEPFAAELQAAVAHPPEPIDQATLLWRLVYHTALVFAEAHPDWSFVRHEDLARNTAPAYDELYRRVRLTMNARVQRAIAAHSAPSNPAEAPRGTKHLLRRDSSAAADLWRSRLTPEQVDRVRSRVEPLSSRFYSDEEW